MYFPSEKKKVVPLKDPRCGTHITFGVVTILECVGHILEDIKNKAILAILQKFLPLRTPNFDHEF